ncbi:MAG TPA: WbqC family protein, partial [Paludibacteraceae bacterium]|nr:WbqC family protein [Paludibacteraceae bacterium]
MKLAIMQPYFLPYIGYFQLIKAVDTFIIYDDVQFIKGGWINRNYLLLNDEKFMFNLILKGASANKLINEISVQSNQNKLLKTIYYSYNKAPYFESVFPIIKNILNYEDKNLSKFIGNSIIKICNYLKIDTEIHYSSALEKDNELKAQDKIIHICKLLNADTYINAIGGQKLYDKKVFNDSHIDLKFIKSNLTPYTQFKNEFIPCLSILDVMMFNSVDEINIILKNHELI